MIEARRMLRNREGLVAKGLPVTPDVGRVTVDEAVADLLNDYALNQRKTTEDTRRRIEKHIRPFFGDRRMIAITTADLRAFVANRQKNCVVERHRRTGKVPPGESAIVEVWQPVSAAELNRELTTLKRMFSLAVQAAKLYYRSHFPMLRENNVRKGFFERDQYLAVLSTAKYYPCNGGRWICRPGKCGSIPGTTKNGEGRVFYLTPELQARYRRSASLRTRSSAISR